MRFVSAEALGVVRWRVGGAAAGRGRLRRLRPITGRGPSAGQHTWTHNSARVFSLHQACYEMRLYQRPPRKARPSKATLAQRMQAIPQPSIGEVALRYLTTVATTCGRTPSSCAPTA
jgi:hypothetical protein